VSTAALACGLVAVGCCDGSVTPLLTTTLIEKTDNELKDPYSRFMALGLGLTLLGLFSLSSLPVSDCEMFCVHNTS